MRQNGHCPKVIGQLAFDSHAPDLPSLILLFVVVQRAVVRGLISAPRRSASSRRVHTESPTSFSQMQIRRLCVGGGPNSQERQQQEQYSGSTHATRVRRRNCPRQRVVSLCALALAAAIVNSAEAFLPLVAIRSTTASAGRRRAVCRACCNMLPDDLHGKVAVVTGASRGIGKGVALTLGQQGCTVYVTGRSAGGTTTDKVSTSSRACAEKRRIQVRIRCALL